MGNLARESVGGHALPGAATALVGRWVRTGSGPGRAGRRRGPDAGGSAPAAGGAGAPVQGNTDPGRPSGLRGRGRATGGAAFSGSDPSSGPRRRASSLTPDRAGSAGCGRPRRWDRRESAPGCSRGAAALTWNCGGTCAGRSDAAGRAGSRRRRRWGCGGRAVSPRTEEKPRGGEAPGLRERGRRSGRRSPSRQVVLGQFIVQVTKLPMFSAPNAFSGAWPSPVRSSSPSASQVQVKETSMVWVQSLVS